MAIREMGSLEVVLVPENDKDKFAAYVSNKINGIEEKYDFHTIKAKEVVISCEGTHVHADDETIDLESGKEIRIELIEGLLLFMVP